MALLAMAIAQPGARGALVHRLAGRRDHRLGARQGQDHRRHPGPPRGRARRGRDRRSSPASRASRRTRKDVTTLGRGGSDTTAVALAAALQRRRLRDLHRRGRHLHRRPADRAERPAHADHVTYEEMLEMAACGAKVLHLRCVEYARRCNAADPRPLVVLEPSTGTLGHRTRWRTSPWNRRSSPASPTTAARPRSPSSGCPTSRARPRAIFRHRRRRRDQHRHDRAERLGRGRPAAPTSRSPLPRTDGPTAMAGAAARSRSQVKLRAPALRRPRRQGLADRRRHALAPGRRGQVLRPPSAAAGVNIEMISTSEIRISVVVPRTPTWTRPSGPPTTPSSWAPTTEAVVYAGTGR